MNYFFGPLTAHCLYGETPVPSNFTIGLGYCDSKNVNSWSVLKSVIRIIQNPSNDSNTKMNGIALMKLDVRKNLRPIQ